MLRRVQAELARAVARLDEVRGLAAVLPRTDRLPRSRVLALARFAAAAKASAVARLPEDRRLATLVAFVRTLEATAQDDVLDLFDIVVTRVFADAQSKGRETRMRGLRDLDAAALTLRDGWGLLLAQEDGADPRGAVFASLPRKEIEAAMARVDALVRPPEDPYFDELLAQHGRIWRFLPGLARAAHLGAAPAARPVLAAVEYLREEGRRGSAKLRKPPIEFVPQGWRSRVIRGGQVCRGRSKSRPLRRHRLAAPAIAGPKAKKREALLEISSLAHPNPGQ